MARQSKEKEATYKRAYAATHREELTAKNRAYRQSHREELKATAAKYRKEHPEVNRAVNRKYRVLYREKVEAQARGYRAANSEKLSAAARAYRNAHPEEYRIHNVHARARRYGVDGTFTVTEWRAMCAWFGNVCLACDTPGELTVDHVTPLLQHGTNYIHNLQPLCKSCNSRKGKRNTDYRDPVQFAAFLQSLKGQTNAD